MVKADRFGYIKRAMHGTTMLTTRAVRYVLSLIIAVIHKSKLSILSKTRAVVGHMVDMQSKNHSFDRDASCITSSEKGKHETMIQMLSPQRKRLRNQPLGLAQCVNEVMQPNVAYMIHFPVCAQHISCFDLIDLPVAPGYFPYVFNLICYL